MAVQQDPVGIRHDRCLSLQSPFSGTGMSFATDDEAAHEAGMRAFL